MSSSRRSQALAEPLRVVAISLALSGIIALSPAEAVQIPRESVPRALSATEDALRRGDLARAQTLLAPLVSAPGLGQLASGERIEVLALWGEVLLGREDPERAIAAFDDARRLATGERRIELTLRLAGGYLAVSDPESARELIESLSATDRERPEAKFLSAVVVYADEDREEARRRLEALQKEQPLAEAAHYLGVLAYERGAHEEALEHFSLAVRLDPRDYYSSVYRSRCLLDLHRMIDAERELRRLKTRHRTPEVSCLLGRVLLRQRRDRDALAEFRAAIRERPSYAEALFGEASALRRLGETDAAREVADRFRRVHLRQEADRRRLDALHQKSLRAPGRWQLRREIAELSRAAGDLEAAERHAWRAVRLSPDEVSCRLLLARVLVDQGRYQAAAVQYQRLLSEHPRNSEARAELERLVRDHARKQ